MPDLLLELRSEEIPARMQRKAAGDLKKLVTDALVDAGLTYEAASEYWTPRRLALDIRGLNARSKDVREERKGPKVGAPEKALEGFLRSAGLSSIDEAQIQSDPKKGDFYLAVIEKPGRPTEEIVAEIMPRIVRDFAWPKSMRWGAASARPGALRWVRPLQSILCTFGPETEEPVVVDFEIDGIRSGNVTYGHRFHAPEAIVVRRFDDYVAKLEAASVVLDAERRKRIILDDAKNLAFASGLELVEDEGLLEEVSGLVEWPVVLLGTFDEAFLDIPPEVIRLTIRANQKCFVTRPQDGEGLSNRFVVTSNIAARDGGAEIAHGNGKVVRARLSDAVHFWKTDQADLPDVAQLGASAQKLGLDLSRPLDQRMARLDHLDVTFHAKLGTQGERVQRIARLAEELAPLVGADGAQARRAALLAKADLQTEIVGEFPELQGAMGRKYAALQGEDPAVAAAVEEHYRPQGPSDEVPTAPVSMAVALADKLDTLVGFWAIDEKPTGSKDPYALRRAALGVIRIVVENGVRLELRLKLAAVITRNLLKSRWAFEAALESETKHSIRARFEALSSSYPLSYAFIAPKKEHQSAVKYLLENAEFEGNKGVNDIIYSTLQGIELAFEDGSIESIDGIASYNELELILKDVGKRIEAISSASYMDDEDLFDDEWMSKFLEGIGVFNNVRLAPIGLYALELADSLLSFLHDRLKVYLREKGAQHDLIDAVLASGSPNLRASGPSTALAEASASSRTGGARNDDLLLVVSRVAALGIFLDTEDGQNLSAGTRRAANILAAEEKKGTRVADAVDPTLLQADSEKALFSAVNQAESEAAQAIQLQDFSAAMQALSALREPVDSFFEDVLVNVEDEAVRANRLALLARIRAATAQVADFSKIAG